MAQKLTRWGLRSAILWEHLRARKLGVQFRRQVVIGQRYIVDFCASSIKLVLEVDGGYHVDTQRADARREAWMKRRDFAVIRVTDEQVTRDVLAAVEVIRSAVMALR